MSRLNIKTKLKKVLVFLYFILGFSMILVVLFDFEKGISIKDTIVNKVGQAIAVLFYFSPAILLSSFFEKLIKKITILKSISKRKIVIISFIIIYILTSISLSFIKELYSDEYKIAKQKEDTTSEINELSNDTEDKAFKKEDKINDTEVVSKSYGEDLLDELQKLGLTLQEATKIQENFYKIGIINISDVQEGAGDGIDKLQSFVAYANDDKEKKFYFTIEERKLYYAGFMDETLYDSTKGGVLKSINDIHIPETEVTMEEYTELQVKAENIIKEYLTNPETATFPMYDGWGIGRSDNDYKIYGKVNADNAMGSNSTMNFSVWFKKEKNEFNVDAVEIDGVRVK